MWGRVEAIPSGFLVFFRIPLPSLMFSMFPMFSMSHLAAGFSTVFHWHLQVTMIHSSLKLPHSDTSYEITNDSTLSASLVLPVWTLLVGNDQVANGNDWQCSPQELTTAVIPHRAPDTDCRRLRWFSWVLLCSDLRSVFFSICARSPVKLCTFSYSAFNFYSSVQGVKLYVLL